MKLRFVLLFTGFEQKPIYCIFAASAFPGHVGFTQIRDNEPEKLFHDNCFSK
jgi:hypothetical protein